LSHSLSKSSLAGGEGECAGEGELSMVVIC
jgi:hypothetical protein